jgi:hypothetical protein
MKKTYINPEMEVVKIMTTGMLATSSLILDDTEEITAIEGVLAPQMPDLDGIIDNSSFDLDSYFE